VQDGLNKSVRDMLVAMEYSAFRQRWAAGIEVDYDTEGKAYLDFVSGIAVNALGYDDAGLKAAMHAAVDGLIKGKGRGVGQLTHPG